MLLASIKSKPAEHAKKEECGVSVGSTCLLSSQEGTNQRQSRTKRQAIKAMLDNEQPVPLRRAT